jgi:hypothetical protein
LQSRLSVDKGRFQPLHKQNAAHNEWTRQASVWRSINPSACRQQ